MSKNNQKWFKKVRSSYVPQSWQGWLSYLPYLLYLIFVYAYVMYSFGYTFFSILLIVPNWLAAFGVMTWLASKKS